MEIILDYLGGPNIINHKGLNKSEAEGLKSIVDREARSPGANKCRWPPEAEKGKDPTSQIRN